MDYTPHTHTQLELIKNSTVAGYKATCKKKKKKSATFQCTSKEKSEMEIKKIIPFTRVSKRVKYLELKF